MRQHSGALERKWNRQLTRPIFPEGAKNAVWKQDYLRIADTLAWLHCMQQGLVRSSIVQDVFWPTLTIGP